MKTEMEIARAHDLITGVILGEVPIVIGGDNRKAAVAALDALCWVLEHRPDDCGHGFAENLARIEAAARMQGFVLRPKEDGAHGVTRPTL